jgi:hypothetical protein
VPARRRQETPLDALVAYPASVSVQPPPFRVDVAVRQLHQSFEAIEWAVGMLREEWHHQALQDGEWSAATNLAHLLVYEEKVSLPIIQALLDGADGTQAVQSGGEGWLAAASEEAGRLPMDTLVWRFRTARGRLIGCVGAFSDADFNAARCAVTTPRFPNIGLHPAGLVVMKSFQHTWEHGNSILKVARLTYQ